MRRRRLPIMCPRGGVGPNRRAHPMRCPISFPTPSRSPAMLRKTAATTAATAPARCSPATNKLAGTTRNPGAAAFKSFAADQRNPLHTQSADRRVLKRKFVRISVLRAGTGCGETPMLYAAYHHRRNAGREVILPDGAPFPGHLRRDDWYVHATYQSVSGRTEADIAALGYYERSGVVTFGRRVAAPHRAMLPRKAG